MKINVSKSVALVTGSTQGIGLSTAKKLAKDHIVVINSNNPIAKDFISKEFKNKEVYFFKADISKKEELLAMRDFIKNNFGRLDKFVAHAGIIPTPCGIEDITDENIHKTIDVNLIGTFNSIKIFGDLIKETTKKGSIVATTSVDGIIGEPFAVMYSATKAGIISLTKSFARYFGEDVRVNAIAPGLIDTPLTDSLGNDPHWTTDYSIIKRVGKAEEVADAVCYLLSDNATFITGQVLAVDGGFTLK